jgi:hypothetical protein
MALSEHLEVRHGFRRLTENLFSRTTGSGYSWIVAKPEAAITGVLADPVISPSSVRDRVVSGTF